MTILIAFHANQYRNFKSYYLEQVTGSKSVLQKSALETGRRIE